MNRFLIHFQRGEFQFTGFGTFEVHKRAERKGSNPQQVKKQHFLLQEFLHLNLGKN
ncbi:HU family DNA-binding protein [Priestia aryabhattai]|uniref:HU family DNA-binding protein n=1 Tax=Priestia megaterium TaxID=1404 RepID=UPI003F981219